jgi:hypothetical protein
MVFTTVNIVGMLHPGNVLVKTPIWAAEREYTENIERLLHQSSDQHGTNVIDVTDAGGGAV